MVWIFLNVFLALPSSFDCEPDCSLGRLGLPGDPAVTLCILVLWCGIQ